MTDEARRVIREPISIREVNEIAQRHFGDMAKACVDIRRRLMARVVDDAALRSEIRRVVDSLIRRE